MAKWTRVGEIPKKIPVNFVVDSEKYPELAAWIYSFPHGEMGKTVRDILHRHAKGQGVGGERREPQPALQVAPAGRPAIESGEAPREVRGMDVGTASSLQQLDEMS